MDAKSHNNERWMRLALKEARKGWGTTNPNPMVGAVVVKNDRLIALGHHEYAGGPHAEVNVLRAAGKAAKGADLYVTMEPCCTYGRTPPCTQAVISAGIKRVFIGSVDDNPKHAGSGIGILEEAGIEVKVGCLEEECRRLNRAFFWWIQHRRPYVILKMAQSLDGRIALANGESKWISGPTSRRFVQKLRRLSDVIMVGGETARRDDPSLLVTAKNWKKQPDVCLWTNRGLPQGLRLLSNADRTVFCDKPVSRHQWMAFLEELGDAERQVLLLEGGGELAAAALKAGIVNEIFWFVAPKFIGGRQSRPSVGGDDISSLDDAVLLRDMTVRRSGDDVVISAFPEVK